MKPGRARCAVPFCRRTAAEAKGYVDQGFLCGTHWRLRSPETRAEWRALDRIIRRNPGPFWDHPPNSGARLIRLAIEREHVALWERTKAEVIEVAMGIAA